MSQASRLVASLPRICAGQLRCASALTRGGSLNNLDHLRHRLGTGGVVGLQEMYPDAFMQQLAQLDGWGHIGHPGGPSSKAVLGGSPIAWCNKGWTLVHHGSEVLNPGHAGISYERRIAWVLLQRLGHREGRHVLVTSRQYVARAWGLDGTRTRRHNPAQAAEQPRRQAIWDDANAADINLLHDLTERFPDAAQVHMGDCNRAGRNPIWGHAIGGRRVRYVAHGLDYIGFVNGQSLTWRYGRHQVVRLHSDHAALIVPATLHGRSA